MSHTDGEEKKDNGEDIFKMSQLTSDASRSKFDKDAKSESAVRERGRASQHPSEGKERNENSPAQSRIHSEPDDCTPGVEHKKNGRLIKIPIRSELGQEREDGGGRLERGGRNATRNLRLIGGGRRTPGGKKFTLGKEKGSSYGKMKKPGEHDSPPR